MCAMVPTFDTFDCMGFAGEHKRKRDEKKEKNPNQISRTKRKTSEESISNHSICYSLEEKNAHFGNGKTYSG